MKLNNLLIIKDPSESCPAGEFHNATLDLCTKCPVDTYSPDQEMVCHSCTVGTRAPEGSVEIEDCFGMYFLPGNDSKLQLTEG